MNKYLIGVPIFVLIFGLIYILGMGLVNLYYHTFRGMEEFETYYQAESYQRMIVQEAEIIDAKVDVSISITSPPTVEYYVVVLGDNIFKYGERMIGVGESWFYYVVFGLIVLISCGVCIYRLKEY